MCDTTKLKTPAQLQNAGDQQDDGQHIGDSPQAAATKKPDPKNGAAGKVPQNLAPTTTATVVYQVKIPYAMTGSQWQQYLKEFKIKKMLSDPRMRNYTPSESYKFSGYGVDTGVPQTDVGSYVEVTLHTGWNTSGSGAPNKPGQTTPGAQPDAYQQWMDEIDRRYYNISKRWGQKIAANDEAQKKIWFEMKKQVLADYNRLMNMPPEIKKIIFAGGRQAEPKDFEKLLLLARKLQNMSPEDLQAYESLVTAGTTDIDKVIKAVDNYNKENKAFEIQQFEFSKNATRLYGLENEFKEYLAYDAGYRPKYSPKTAVRGRYESTKDYKERVGMIEQGRANAERKLIKDLKAKGFTSINDFETAIKTYLDQFRQQAAFIGLRALDRSTNILNKEAERYNNFSNVSELRDKLNDARKDLQESEASYLRAQKRMLTSQGTDVAGSAPLYEQAKAEKEASKAKIKELSGSYPVLRMQLMLDKEKDWLKKDPKGLQVFLKKFIEDRKKNVDEVRPLLEASKTSPLGQAAGDFVLRLDKLVTGVKQINGIKDGSIGALIIDNKIQEDVSDAIVGDAFLGVIALGLGALTWGYGTVATLGEAGSAGIMGYMAVRDFEKYSEDKAAYNIDLKTDDPSLFWLIVSLGTAAIGVSAVAGKALNSTASKIIQAGKIFNETRSLSQFEKTVSSIEEISDGIRAMKQRAIQAAKLQEEIFKDLNELSGSLKLVGDDPLVQGFSAYQRSRLYNVALNMAKQGLLKFEDYLSQLRLNKVIKAADLSDETKLKLLKEIHTDALVELERLEKIFRIGSKMPINAENYAGEVFFFDIEKNPRLLKSIKTSIQQDFKLGTPEFENELKIRLHQLDELNNEFRDGVRFTEEGFPDFEPYIYKEKIRGADGVEMEIPVRVNVDQLVPDEEGSAADMQRAVEKFRKQIGDPEWKKPDGYTWHHIENTTELELIPTKMHKMVRHSGGRWTYFGGIVSD